MLLPFPSVMMMGVNPVVSNFLYVNLSKSENQTIELEEIVTITFDGVASGSEDLFNDANDSIVVPSGASLVRGSIGYWQTDTFAFLRKNGASYSGEARGRGQNEGLRSFAGPPLIVSPSDEFTFEAENGVPDSVHEGATWTWLGLEIMDPDTVYCLVRRSTDLARTGGTFGSVAWNVDIADAYGMHSTSSNTSRIITHASAVAARPFGMICTDSNAEIEVLSYVNGGSYNGGAMVDTQNDVNAMLSWYGAIVPVTGGTTYFETMTFNSVDQNIEGGDQESYFGVECFDDEYSYCTAYKSATQALTADVSAVLLLESEVEDTDNCHSTASNKGNFVCPAGKTQARLSFNVKGASTSGTNNLYAIAQKDGSHVQGLPRDGRQNSAQEELNGIGNWIPVEEGDVLRVVVTSSVNQTLPAVGQTWVCVEWR